MTSACWNKPLRYRQGGKGQSRSISHTYDEAVQNQIAVNRLPPGSRCREPTDVLFC